MQSAMYMFCNARCPEEPAASRGNANLPSHVLSLVLPVGAHDTESSLIKRCRTHALLLLHTFVLPADLSFTLFRALFSEALTLLQELGAAPADLAVG